MAPQPHSPRTQSPLTPGKPPPRAVRGADLRLIPAHAGKTNRDSILGPKVAAHPRSRGENPIPSIVRLTYGGSSPLTRGKLCLGRPAHALIGLIPAHAGKTFLQPSMLPNSPGSSPLTRGKLAASEARALQIGLIPAHAGKTTKTETPPPSARAHPRSRGENGVSPIADDCGPGSSPLTRGKQGEAVSGSQTRRLIPAHAGKTHM